MSQFIIQESDQFIYNVEEAAVWILESNFESSEEFALQKLSEFQNDIELLKERLQQFPESGEGDEVKGVRKFPIYAGRYSVKWIVQKSERTVTLIALTDSKYPKQLKAIQLDDL